MSKKSTTPNGSQPPRQRVANALRARIRNGELLPGMRLPTQQELTTEFTTNRSAVRQALADLQAEGLLTNPGRGVPPTVADSHRPPEAPRPAGVELADRIHAAFEAEHVTIDTFSFTTETLNAALAGPRLAIDAGELSPRSIRVRALVPGPEAHLALPRLVSDPTDHRPLERLHELTRIYASTLVNDCMSLQLREQVPDISVEIRTLAVTPLQKLYLLNGTEALHGYYRVEENTVPYQQEPMEIYDVLGIDAKLFRHSAGPDSRDEQEVAFVEESQVWFDSLWSTIAQTLTLG